MKTKFARLATLLLLLTVLLSLGSVNAFASVTQSDGNHEEWVDRIELDGVQYAIDFKNWLDENSDMEAIANGGLQRPARPDARRMSRRLDIRL